MYSESGFNMIYFKSSLGETSTFPTAPPESLTSTAWRTTAHSLRLIWWCSRLISEPPLSPVLVGTPWASALSYAPPT